MRSFFQAKDKVKVEGSQNISPNFLQEDAVAKTEEKRRTKPQVSTSKTKQARRVPMSKKPAPNSILNHFAKKWRHEIAF